MTNATQMPLGGLKHLNRGLFSDYYLEHIAPTLEEWKSDEVYVQAAALRDELRVLLDGVHPELLDEAQLEDQWVKPVLELLGHHWSVQVKVRYRERGYRKPDYIFTSTGAEANALSNQIYEPAEIAHALAVGDAKKWGVSLDQASGPEGRNPSQQIDEYLRFSELNWGILTDGRIWRLYERNSSKSNSYYAVDLPNLLRQETSHPFLYFYLFFRQQAFTSGWLERVLKGSEELAQALSDKLEDQVYEALELIAQGFLNYRRNRLQPDAATLQTIYEQSLVLLYRLLFIFYAESREILPLNHNDAYTANKSLNAIKKAVEQRLRFPAGLDADNTQFYTWLRDLFFIIDSGSEAHDLPPYNGRLFSEPDHPFLTEKAVGDSYLVPALDSLARVDEVQRRGRAAPKRVFVDYRDLDVRHLGAVYEKLLEYQLDIADAPLVLKEGKFVPAAAGETPVKQPGEVYLRTGSNERKITGSYYTPDYIVRYIVEQTLEPLLSEITRQYAELDETGHWLVLDRAGLRKAILDLNVIDPATGSGHFMVEATAYIAEWLRRLALQPDDLAAGEDELVYWKRQVVTACIYGVDVNPLAVELAKLSLWLTTLGRGKPLSFLDHHVQAGNSLVGIRIAEIEAPAQLSLLNEAAFTTTVGDAVSKMTSIEETLTSTIRQVKQQEQTYARLADGLMNWRLLADVWTAEHFGQSLDAADWQAVYDTLVNDRPNDQARSLIARAEALAAEYRFFHWELAFPEVFFTPDGQMRANPGFDAVIGNPPYVRQERLQPIKPFLQAHYKVYQGTADLYVYFYNQALDLLRMGGLAGYITANKWLRAAYGEPLRAFLSTAAETRQIVDFGHAPIFKDADTFPCIVVISKPQGERAPDTAAQVTQFPRESLERVTLADYTHTYGYAVPLSRFSAQAWSLERADVDSLMDKIRHAGIPLREYINSSPYFGIKTGFNEAFLIDTPTKERLVREDLNCAKLLKPYLRGQDIQRWSPEWAGLWMILLKSSENQDWEWSKADDAEDVFAQTFPSLYGHLKPLEAGLRKRQDHGRYWWELRSCAYYDIFEHTKLVHTDITWRPQFALSIEPQYLLNSAYIWTTDDLYLLAVVNSPLMWAYMWRNAAHGKDEALRLFNIFVESMPIAPPTDETRSETEIGSRRLITLSNERRVQRVNLLDWLHVEFGIETPGQKLEAFAALVEDDFIEEVRKRRPSSAARLSPAALRDLRETFNHSAYEMRALEREAGTFERRLSDLVNAAYGLAPEEIDLMWKTAPPRMPIKPPSSGSQS